MAAQVGISVMMGFVTMLLIDETFANLGAAHCANS
jgi:hypothetical protein